MQADEKMVRVSLTLPTDVYEKLVEAAREECRSVAGMTRWILLQSIEEDEREARRPAFGFGVRDGGS